MENLTENKVRLVGHAGADPKVKYLNPETCSATISLATNAEGVLNEMGVMVRGFVTDWHTILCYGALAEEVDKSIQTGDLIEVEGRLTYIKIQTHTRVVNKAVILAHSVEILKKKEKPVVSPNDAQDEHIHNPYGEYLETLQADPDGLPF